MLSFKQTPPRCGAKGAQYLGEVSQFESSSKRILARFKGSFSNPGAVTKLLALLDDQNGLQAESDLASQLQPLKEQFAAIHNGDGGGPLDMDNFLAQLCAARKFTPGAAPTPTPGAAPTTGTGTTTPGTGASCGRVSLFFGRPSLPLKDATSGASTSLRGG